LHCILIIMYSTRREVGNVNLIIRGSFFIALLDVTLIGDLVIIRGSFLIALLDVTLLEYLVIIRGSFLIDTLRRLGYH